MLCVTVTVIENLHPSQAEENNLMANWTDYKCCTDGNAQEKDHQTLTLVSSHHKKIQCEIPDSIFPI
jgi:hypothetical protein